MSFWDNVKKIAQPYADDEYDDYDDGLDGYEEETPRRSRGSVSTDALNLDSSRGSVSTDALNLDSTPAASTPKTSGFSGQVLNMSSGKQEVVLFRPTCFNDSTKAADDLRDKKAIIVNMENVDNALARRVVDFLTGCAYALDGKVNKIAQSTYLFSPHSMDVSGDLEHAASEAESYI